MAGALGSLANHRGLLWQMTRRDLRGRYAGSLIGVFWTVINPLLLLAVFTFIFTIVFKARFGEGGVGLSALYILAGILPWLAFADGLGRSGSIILDNKNLVTRTRFPLAVIPAFPAFSSLLGQLAGLCLLIVIAGFGSRPPGPSLVLLPALLALQLIFTIGLALAAASIAIYLRDLIHALPVLLLVWMYATPVFYPASLVPEKYQLVIALNPMARLINAYRCVILEGAWPGASSLIFIAAAAAGSLIIGSLVFNRLAAGIADRL